MFSQHPVRLWRAPLLILALLPLAGCDTDDPDPDDPTVIGSLYTMTNDATGNEVVVYDRRDDGSLDERDRVDARGNGTGPGELVPADPLASQDALVLSPDEDLLFGLNAGSNSIAAFQVEDDGDLDFTEAEPSGGVMPVSIAISPDEQFLYVVHAMGVVDGGAGSIRGFTIDPGDGALTAIADSERPLSGADTTLPAQIAFSPDGNWLIVTEKATNAIVTYAIGDDGVPSDPVVTPSTGMTPFGAMFASDGTLIVSNAAAPTPLTPVPDGGTVTSYAINGDGTLAVVTPTSPSYGTAACWIELSENEDFVYTTNTGSASISGYALGSDGTLDPLAGDELVVIGVANAAPLDMARAGTLLYTVSGDALGGDGTISVHRIEADGTLSSIDDAAASGLPAYVTGLDAR